MGSLEPRHSLRRKPSTSAAREFTDRVPYLQAFTDALADEGRTQAKVLNFHGLGGIGKTSLRHEIERRLRALTESGSETAAPLWTSLNFETPAYRQPEEALFALRTQMLRAHGIQFPTFDIAYAVYRQKVTQDSPLERQGIPLFEESTIVAEIMGLAACLPLASLVPTIAVAVKKSSRAIQDWWVRRGCDDLNGIEFREPTEILEWLPAYWAEDLAEHLARVKRRGVILLDTYEVLFHAFRGGAGVADPDEWVRDLILNLGPNVLWAVFGQERLQWGEDEPAWGEIIESHVVGGLAESDVRHFLTKAGVADHDIQSAIIAGSEGVPYYIDLQVDQYYQIVGEGGIPQADDFAGTPSKVFKRFMKYLDKEEREALRVLAPLRRWDALLFESLMARFNTGYPATAVSDLCRFSFVSDDDGQGWRMHGLMKSALLENTDSDLVRRVHAFAEEYYRESAFSEPESGGDRVALLIEAAHHGILSGGTGVLEWLEPTCRDFDGLPTGTRDILALLDVVFSDLEKAVGLADVRAGDIAVYYAMGMKEVGRLDEADALVLRLLEIRRAEPVDPLALARAEHARGRVLYNLSRPEPAEEHIATAMALFLEHGADEFLSLANVHNDYACVMGQLGKPEQQLEYFERAAEYGRRLDLEGGPHYETANGLANLAGAYRDAARYEDATRLLDEAFACMEQLGERRAQCATRLWQSRGHLASAQEDWESAYLAYRTAVEESGLPALSTPDLVYIESQIARMLVKLGRSDEAREVVASLIPRVIDQETHRHREIHDAIQALMPLLHTLEMHDESETLLSESVRLQEQAGDAATRRGTATLMKLAELRERQGRIDEAESLYRQVLVVRKAELGTPHKMLTGPLYRLGLLCLNAKRIDEAETNFAECLEVERATYAGPHDDWAITALELAKVQVRLGKHEAALESFTLAADTWGQLGERKVTAAARARVGLASSLLAVGRRDEARAMLETALEPLADASPDAYVARAWWEAAVLAEKLEDLELALGYLRNTLAAERVVYGADSTEIADTHERLGTIFEKLGHTQEARLEQERALEIRQTALKGDDASRADALRDLAKLRQEQGLWGAAEQLLSEALDLHRAAEGDVSMAVARDQLLRGRIFDRQDRFRDAVDAYRESVAIREALGQTGNMPYVLHDLGDALLSMGHADEAREVLERALEGKRELLGDEDPQTLITRRQYLAALYLAGGEQEARSVIAELADATEELVTLGAYLRSVEPQAAIPVLVDALEALDADGCAEGDPRVVSCLDYLGGALTLAGLTAAAADVFMRLIDETDGVEGEPEESERTANALIQAARAKSRLGDSDTAVEMVTRALDIRVACLGPSHPSVASACTQLGMVLRDSMRLRDAVDVINRGIRTLEESLVPDKPKLANAYWELGRTYKHASRREQAEEAFAKVLALEEEVYGGASDEVRMTLVELARTSQRSGDHAQAIAYARRVHDIADIHGFTNARLLSVKQFMVECLFEGAEYHECIAVVDQALALANEDCDADDIHALRRFRERSVTALGDDA